MDYGEFVLKLLVAMATAVSVLVCVISVCFAWQIASDFFK